MCRGECYQIQLRTVAFVNMAEDMCLRNGTKHRNKELKSWFSKDGTLHTYILHMRRDSLVQTHNCRTKGTTRSVTVRRRSTHPAEESARQVFAGRCSSVFHKQRSYVGMSVWRWMRVDKSHEMYERAIEERSISIKSSRSSKSFVSKPMLLRFRRVLGGKNH
jgi:hypothetical protein